ncbi:MAG TPA: hypothetical protein VH394_23785 [Thermoanaerobaculia bacterium]|nr:hypothetical protein [Thermoanaerobaculia bacterium]
MRQVLSTSRRPWSLWLILAFLLALTPAAAKAPEQKQIQLVSLEDSLKPIEQFFNANRNRTRAIVLLAPT